MRKLFALLTLVLSLKGILVHAISAYPFAIPIDVDGQTIYIKMFGDEYCKWAETEDGYTIVQNNDDQWCYAELSAEGYLRASDFTLRGPSQETDDKLANFLASMPRHLKARAYNQPAVRRSQAAPRKTGKAIGERRILVILMEFQDVKFIKNVAAFDNLFNKEGYHDDGAQGSVKDFYLSSSFGKLTLSCDIYGVYTAKRNMSYYGSNDVRGQDTNPYALFQEAVENVSKEVDLKIYDGDGDGYLDNVHIIYAGYGEEAGAAASAIWAHESRWSPPYSIDGVSIDRYSCSPELRDNRGNGISRIGVCCHEIGHALGAMDYYDTNYATGGEYPGTGQWDVMASGSWNNKGITPADFNPYVKAVDYGWITLKSLPDGDVLLHPSAYDAESYFVIGASGSSDYYIFENRSKDKWGASLPGAGMLVFHIHPGIAESGNEINATAPQKCYVVCASSSSKQPSSQPASYGAVNSAGCPYPGSSDNHSFMQKSTPQPFYWDGSDCGIEIDNITLLNNGDIEMFNLSSGDDFKPFELTQLFTEDFEDTPLYSVTDSKNGDWTVIDDKGSGMALVTRPRANSGSKSLQLSPKNVYAGNASSCIEFSCSVVDTVSYVQLSGFYTSYKLSSRKANSLRIGYKGNNADDWKFSEFKSSVNLTWNSFIINIPSGNKDLYFRIEGDVLAGTILAIDNLKVEQQIVVSGMDDVHTVGGNVAVGRSEFFGLNGQRRSVLRRGLNIVRMDDGTYKKLYLKQ